MNVSNQMLPLPQLPAEAAPRQDPASGGAETGPAGFQDLLQKRRELDQKGPGPEPGRRPALKEETAGADGQMEAPDPSQAGWAALLVLQPDPALFQALAGEEAVPPAGAEAAGPVAGLEAGSIPAALPEQAADGGDALPIQARTAPLAEAPAQPAPPRQGQEAQAPMSADPDPAVRERPTADRQPIAEASGNSRSGGGAEAQGGQEDWRVVDIRQDAGARPLFQAVEHVPVKVGGPPSVDMTSPDPKPQLAQQVGQALERGEQTLTLQLSPRYLGRVTVELTRTEDGALQVLLRPETAKAAQLLAEHSSGLGSLLQSGSHAPVQVEVQRYQESQQAQQHHAQDQQYNGQEGHSGGQRREQRQQQDQSQRFLQQFRLGLVSLSPEGP